MRLKMSLVAAVALSALLVVAACDGDGEEGEDGTEATATVPAQESPTAVPSPPAEVCPLVDGEVVQAVFAALALEKTTYESGEPIEMPMRLVNCASHPITRHFSDAQRYDFSVSTPDGEEIWRWSNGMVFAEVIGEETLGPSEEVTFTETWEQVDNDGQPVEPGQYQVRAESTGCDESLDNCGPSALLTIDIVAP